MLNNTFNLLETNHNQGYSIVMNDREVKKLFGKNLKEIRKSRKLTQEKLSELAEMQPQMIRQLESGRNFLSASTLAKLVDVLNINPMYFFSPDKLNLNKQQGRTKDDLINLLGGCDELTLGLIYDIVYSVVNSKFLASAHHQETIS